MFHAQFCFWLDPSVKRSVWFDQFGTSRIFCVVLCTWALGMSIIELFKSALIAKPVCVFQFFSLA